MIPGRHSAGYRDGADPPVLDSSSTVRVAVAAQRQSYVLLIPRDLGRSTILATTRVHLLGLVVLAGTLYAPYAFAGPGFFTDDWFSLRNGALEDWWMAAGADQWRARPAGAAIYAVTFGLIGERPLVHFLLAAMVMTAAAVVMYRVAARFVPVPAAWLLAATWLVLPTHTSLEMWASCLNIALALLFLGLGTERLTRPEPARRNDLVAAGLFGIGVLAYEAIAPAALAVALVVGWRRHRRRLDAVLPSVFTVGVAGLWMLANWHPDKEGLDTTLNPWFVIPAHFGETITGAAWSAEVLIVSAVLLATVLVGIELILSDRRRNASWPDWMLAAGWGLIVLGTLPFIRYFYSPIGFGDRVLVVSSVGGAMVIVASVCTLGRWWRPLGAALAVVVIAAAVPQRISMVSDYAVAADDGRRIRATVEERWLAPPDGQLVFGPEPIKRRNIVAFYDVASSMQLLYMDPSVRARMTYRVEDFQAAPDEYKVDIRGLSKLDDGQLGDPVELVDRSDS